MNISSVSVIVPTYNRYERLLRVVAALEGQVRDDWDYEIIIVSDGSSDGTEDELPAHLSGRARLLTQQNAGPGVARNTGVAAASGDLVVFIDDDVIPEPSCLQAHVAAHRRSDGPRVVIGPLLTPESVRLSPYVEWEQRMLYKQYDAIARGEYPVTARQFYTGNASIPRTILDQVGGFDGSFRRAEDVELGYRLADAGLPFELDMGAEAHHFAERSFEGWLAIASAYGRNDVVFWRDRGQGWLVPRIRAEFDGRHPLNRFVTRTGVRFPVVGRVVAATTKPLVERAPAPISTIIGQRMLSALYGMRYYEALAEELGGMDEFLAVQPGSDLPGGGSVLD